MTSKKNKRLDWRNQYDFSLENGLTEKKSYLDLKANPTAVIYARVSDIKQVTDWNGLESQENACRLYAQNHWMRVLNVFRDEGISWAVMERDWLTQLINYLTEANKNWKKVAYLLCTEVSRLSRWSLAESELIQKSIEATWVEIILTTSWMNITNTNSWTQMMSDIYKIWAKQERNNIRDRSVLWSTNKLRMWEWIFTPPAWYERTYIKQWWRTEKKLEQIEPSASILKEWLELFANWVIENKSKLTNFFNEKHLKSNFHSATWKELCSTFTDRLLTIEKLYFYAGYIFYPNDPYNIIEPIEWTHKPLITLSLMWKILNRLKIKWVSNTVWRHETSDMFPLRWLIRCPYCHFHMTWWWSRGKMWKLYYYYWCNRQDCPSKENIPIEQIHQDYEKMLGHITVHPEIIKLSEWILKEKMQDKNGFTLKVEQWYRNRIKEIDCEIASIEDKINKLSKPELIAKLETQWSILEEEKSIIEKKIEDWRLAEDDFNKIFEKIKLILWDPISVRRYWPTSLKQLQVRVLYGDEIFYKKNEGFQTLTDSASELPFQNIFDLKSLNGATSEEYFKLFDQVRFWYKEKEDLITAYIARLQSEPQFSYIFESY